MESLDQTLHIAVAAREAGARLLRGGAFKPRTNPRDFQGLGEKGLEILVEARRMTGLGIVTEVMDPRLVNKVADVADMLQVGSRSMGNYPLLKEVGRTKKPILLNRNWSATLDEWLCAAEYVAAEGNKDIVLCERGIRGSSHGAYARCILDLNVIDAVRRISPLPIVVDPSHATGHWKLVPPLSRAALACGAHGLLVETVGDETDRASLACDEDQGIPPQMLAELVRFARGMKVPQIVA